MIGLILLPRATDASLARRAPDPPPGTGIRVSDAIDPGNASAREP